MLNGTEVLNGAEGLALVMGLLLVCAGVLACWDGEGLGLGSLDSLLSLTFPVSACAFSSIHATTSSLCSRK